MGCASSAPFNPGAVANDAPLDAAEGVNGGGLVNKLRRNAGDIVETTTDKVIGDAQRFKDDAMAKMQEMGETIEETAGEAVDKVGDKLTSTFKDLTSAAEEKAEEVEEDAAAAEAAIAEAKARTEEDIENEVRNMVEDLEHELPPPDMPPPDSEKAPAESDKQFQDTDDAPQPDSGVIITEVVCDESTPDTSDVNLGFVEIPGGSDGELLSTPRDALEKEFVGSPPPSATSRPTSALQETDFGNNFHLQAVPYPFANLTEPATNDEATTNEEKEEDTEAVPENEHEETADEERAESPAYEEIINASPTDESNDDNANVDEPNNNDPITNPSPEEDAIIENNNTESTEKGNDEDEAIEESPTEQKDENDNEEGKDDEEKNEES